MFLVVKPFYVSINENGFIVGSMYKTGEGYHAFMLTPTPEPGTLILLGIAIPFLRKKI
jgi:hypothetical protein